MRVLVEDPGASRALQLSSPCTCPVILKMTLIDLPQAETLKTSEFQWLYDLLVCFNKGNLHQYEELCVKHADKLNAQPALVENERKLREKITILCLLELIARSAEPCLKLIMQQQLSSSQPVCMWIMRAMAAWDDRHVVVGLEAIIPKRPPVPRERLTQKMQ